MSATTANVKESLDTNTLKKAPESNKNDKDLNKKPRPWQLDFIPHSFDETSTYYGLPSELKGKNFPIESFHLTSEDESSDIWRISFVRYLVKCNAVAHTPEIINAFTEVHIHFRLEAQKAQKHTAFNKNVFNNLGNIRGNSISFYFNNEDRTMRWNEIHAFFDYLISIGAIQEDSNIKDLRSLILNKSISAPFFFLDRLNILSNKNNKLEEGNSALKQSLEQLRLEMQALKLAVAPLLGRTASPVVYSSAAANAASAASATPGTAAMTSNMNATTGTNATENEKKGITNTAMVSNK